MFKCNRCKSVSISLVNQYTVNLYFNGSHWGTEYANISTRENHNTRLSSLFKDYEFDFYKTGSYETCNDCDYIQNHNTTTQRKMAYGV